MNNYITLDSYRYKCDGKSWKPGYNTPKAPRFYLNGGFSVTFHASKVLTWEGNIRGPVTASGQNGTITNLRASLSKRQLLSFTDHYGVTTSVLISDYTEASMAYMWDGATNVVVVHVKMTGVST